MLSLLMKNGASSSGTDSVDPSKNTIKPQPNQSQHLYPNLSQPPPKYQQPFDEQKQTIPGDNLNENNTITSDSDELIELEPEGIPMITKPSPSYIPPINSKSIDQICKSLNSSIGLFKGKSKRTKVFQNMLLTTTKSDRIAIRRRYFQKYKASLTRVITRNFNGTFRQLLLYSMMNNEELYVNQIEYALKNKNINQLINVLCILDNATLQSVQKTFNASIYHKTKSLKQWTHSITSNIFYRRNVNKFLLNILNGKRENDGIIDMKRIERDCNGLYKNLRHATKQNVNKELLIKVFTTRSFEHLYYVTLKYQQLYGKSLVDVLKPFFSKTSQTGYAILLILKYVMNKYDVFSTFLARSVHSNDGYISFLRFIMIHYDYDLKNIIDNYGHSALDSWIKLELRNKGNYDTTYVVMRLCGLG